MVPPVPIGQLSLQRMPREDGSHKLKMLFRGSVQVEMSIVII